ncbi:nuclear pore complex protein Nup107 [Galendromus occidentalis]|uniref:Nuclear pore complex protein n=1 Tax=Galendromus occidentalis TaxID=34638 RepID=A0AAJ6QP71_9ACAR|nr:nuclear pore complex protein Nup107 [Galendromus occidentalis]
MISSTPRQNRRAQTPDHERSVYSTLFPTTPTSSRTNRGPIDNSISEYTVNLAALESTAQTLNTSIKDKQAPASREAHREFCDAQYAMGRNESFLIDPIPLIERYSKLSAEVEDKLQGRAPEIRDLNKFFHKEKYTWTLAWALLNAAQGGDTDIDVDYHMRLPASDAEEIEDLFDSSCAFRMAQTLVDWLEKRYEEEKCSSNTASLHAFKESGGMYEATRQGLAKGKGSPGSITELDPDAPLRQNRAFHDQDVEDEQRLFRCVFELVRAGNFPKAQKLAMGQGYFMLAAGMQGWMAFRGNIRDDSGALLPDEGNPYRDVWKIVVWKKLNDERVSVPERAIYAALCGNLEMLLPMCPTWEDQLWAHLKTLVDVAIELHLRNARGADLGPLPDDYPKENETLQQILSGLEARVELEGQDFFRQIHKFLMLQDVDGLIDFMYNFCVEISDVENHGSLPGHHLRLMANLALFLKYSRNLQQSVEKIDLIVAFYVQRLIDEEIFDIVPKYVLHLPDVLRETCYLRLLTVLQDLTEKERLDIILAAQRQDIAIFKYIMKFVYDAIHCGNDNAEARDEVTGEDLEKNDALKWLFAQPGHSLLGMKYVNSALRNAIMKQRPSVARSIIALVPQDSVRELAAMAVQTERDSMTSARDDSVMSVGGMIQPDSDGDENMGYPTRTPVDDVEAKTGEYKKCLKEYLCAQEYLEALQSFNEWFQHYHRERPVESVAANTDASSARGALSNEFAKRALASKMETWKATLGGLCDRASRHLKCILNYPDGGWMCDPSDEIVDDDIEMDASLEFESRRRKELQALRRICIPQVTSLLQTVLHGTGRYAESMAIANLIAHEDSCLYNEFSKDDLAQFLVKVQESAVELLKVPGNMDPYGMGEI